MIPLGTDRPLRRRTIVTHALILANILVFVASAIAWAQPEESAAARFFDGLVLDPRNFRFWTLVTSVFLHAGLWHILGNMVFLYVFGPNVEDRMGRAGFLVFYLLGGVAASLAHIAFEQAPAVGASGAISAVTGAFIVFFPGTKIRTLIIFLIIGVFWIPSILLIGFAIAKDMLFQGFGGDDGVARIAHLGGYAFGVGVALALLALRLAPREPYDLLTILRQANRRRQFRRLTAQGAAAWSHEAPAQPRPDARRRRAAPGDEAPVDKEIADARGRIARRLLEHDAKGAMKAYIALREKGDTAALSRKHQIDIANHLYKAGEHAPAAEAYEAFLKAYREDPEAPRVRLMLGLLYARYLGQPSRARPLLERARSGISDASQRELAEALLAEIGHPA